MTPDSSSRLNRANAISVSAVIQTERWRSPSLLAVAFFAVCISCHRAPSTTHSISLTFDYDFTVNHGCSPTLMSNCIARFNVYDMSTGNPAKLFTIPAPSGASGPVKDIIGKSPQLNIRTGKHLLAVSAQMSSGEESSLQLCTTWTLLP
jgi:hypothetical protein